MDFFLLIVTWEENNGEGYVDDKKVEREERRSIIYGDLGGGCKIERERDESDGETKEL